MKCILKTCSILKIPMKTLRGSLSIYLNPNPHPPLHLPTLKKISCRDFDFAQKFVRDKVISQVCTKKF